MQQVLFQFVSFFFSYCDAPVAGQWNTQDPATPIMEGMVDFHEFLMSNILFIGVVVFYLLGWILYHYNETKNPEPLVFSHHNLLEIIWTIIPAIILIILAIPSFTLLYSLDETMDPSVTVKVIGHQWYWTYQYSDYVNSDNVPVDIIFDSYQMNDESAEESAFIPRTYEYYTFPVLYKYKDFYQTYLSSYTKIRTGQFLNHNVEIVNLGKLPLVKPQPLGWFRLLDCDNRVILPVRQHIRFLITSSDVLHSWAVPSFGIKLDACPGRLSQVTAFVKRIGVFYGQCSELCGVNHAFMPIAISVVDLDTYAQWVQMSVAVATSLKYDELTIQSVSEEY